MSVCDGVMLDVKAWEEESFYRLTEGSNVVVKENLRRLAAMDKLQELRIVCQEEYVDALQVIKGIAETVPEEVRQTTLLKLIRFRNVGVRGKMALMSSPSMAYMNELVMAAEEHGFGVIRVV